MLKHKSIVFLGTTGLEKRTISLRLCNDLQNRHNIAYKVFDLEHDYFPRSQIYTSFANFLVDRAAAQARIWTEAWSAFSSEFTEWRQKHPDGLAILCIHGCYVRSDGGVRPTLNISKVVSDFEPTLIVSLIQDIYTTWHCADARYQKDRRNYRPRLTDLLDARIHEIFVGDMISQQVSTLCRHVLMPVNHPLRFLSDLVVYNYELSYLSFPITAAREIKEDGVQHLVAAIDDIHKRVTKAYFERDEHRYIPISPLAIDELPLVAEFEKQKANGGKSVLMCPVHRWPLKSLWGEEIPLIGSAQPDQIGLPIQDVGEAVQLIKHDISRRDYRLVRQAQTVGVICPKPKHRDRLSRGVMAEILAAQMSGDTRIFIWQKPEWDESDIVGKRFFDSGDGTMAPSMAEQLFVRCRSESEIAGRLIGRNFG